MKKVLIHLADLHYRKGWVEEQGVVFNAFFDDIKSQIEKIEDSDFYLIFSGDIVQSGADSKLYDEFILNFDRRLDQIGIPKSHRICVPGNHDVSVDQIRAKMVDHEGVVSQMLDETRFNTYIETPSSVFCNKFGPYKSFELKFAELGTMPSKLSGEGWNLDDNIGVYCLNSALCSSGGIEGKADQKRLAIDTRSLHSWISSCNARWKVLVMHHPLNWLVEWAQKELKIILRKNFKLCLTGHDHEQTVLHSICNETELIECSAPPLFTKKTDLLGYSIISIDTDIGVTNIAYRQWTKYHSWVPGVNFSNTRDGQIKIKEKQANKAGQTIKSSHKTNFDFINRYFNRRLDEALVTYSSQPIVWVDPVICTEPETSDFDQPAEQISLSNLISSPKSTIIKAPPQFGLTCLAYSLIKRAWRTDTNNLWLYIDSEKLKPHRNSIEKVVKAELEFLGCEMQDVNCLIIDSWISQKKDSQKLLLITCQLFPDIPVIVMQTTENKELIDIQQMDEIDRTFQVFFLWSLPRGHVRKVIHTYNEKKPIGDEDKVTTKVVTDLEVLNLHRTPLNCLTLLKVSEIDFDESPVNRTEMIKRVLFLLFNVDDIPTYKPRPDLKDCEYVLGYFCEIMLRNRKFNFTPDYFLEELQKFCTEKVIDLEVQVVFDVLYFNNILVRDGNQFYFRFSYWIYYFAAQRMHHDKKFAAFIFDNMRYANYPEIIEFYTGIDRRREDALKVLINDLNIFHEQAKEKVGLPDELNPYQFAYWSPSKKAIEQMKDEILNGVLNSNLPDSVKDEYADRYYDRTKPYRQEIRTVIEDYSFGSMMQVVRAAARALRNSDYASPEIKIALLKNILRCWDQSIKVVLILLPLLALKGNAIFDGANVCLLGNFGDSIQQRLEGIFKEIPNNIVSWYQTDIFSRKMGPLLIQQFLTENNELKKHLLALLLIKQRPRQWRKYVENYVADIKKNSFYLMDAHRNLCSQYIYSYVSSSTLSDIKYLIKMIIAKHEYGTKKPGVKLIKKIKDDGLPTRLVE